MQNPGSSFGGSHGWPGLSHRKPGDYGEVPNRDSVPASTPLEQLAEMAIEFERTAERTATNAGAVLARAKAGNAEIATGNQRIAVLLARLNA